MNQLNQLLNRKQSKGKPLGPEDVLRVRHEFMKAYGWICDDDWNNFGLDKVFELLGYIQEDKVTEYEWRKTLLKAHGAKIK